jgi:DNA-binding protein H-NS
MTQKTKPIKKKKKKKNKNKKTKVWAVPGNCPDRQTDRHVALIYKITYENIKMHHFRMKT